MKRAKSVRGASGADFEVGQRIRLLRVERDLSQAEMGDQIGVSFQQIQKYEKGTNRLSVGRLGQIAKLLKTTPHDLMGWDNKGPVIPIDVESYKLAKTFVGMREEWKQAVRTLISTLMRDE
jgi:transcriptional regulator with XRE-family HTH domain